ncbi:MAG: HAD-IIIC family phosphatase [Lachnospiraceae bacterium]|jgi:FkbH-like protein|nr:HAD-IIIC family phosphatase [Lachnospiraceae bacterium]
MTYIELKQQIERLQQTAAECIQAEIISDMPLQPWFELYLQEAWAKLGKKAHISRTPWEERQQPKKPDTIRIIWPGPQAVQLVQDEADIRVSQERLSSPLFSFYGAAWPPSQTAEPPFARDGVLNLEWIIAEIGLERSMAKGERRWGDYYSAELQKQVAIQAVRLYETRHGRRKKCIVLDCDGVLWGGVVSEDGIAGIQIAETGTGQAYHQFQSLLKRLQEHGIILAVCSKNEPEDVKQVFRSHTAMVLKEEDIAAWSISWKPKSEQIADLADILQLDPQDMVLIDDQEWELAQVKSHYPQMGSVWFQKETIFKKLAEQIWIMPEDQNAQNQLRLQTYQDNVKREELRKNAVSYEEFLNQLDTRIRIQPAKESDLARISDLSRRANRCTNGVRYTAEELRQNRQGYELQAVFMSDVYRDLGLVGCIGLDRNKKSLDLFCLSCRALGREAEKKLISQLPEWIQSYRWQDTTKNEWLRQWLRSQRNWKEIK